MISLKNARMSSTDKHKKIKEIEKCKENYFYAENDYYIRDDPDGMNSNIAEQAPMSEDSG